MIISLLLLTACSQREQVKQVIKQFGPRDAMNRDRADGWDIFYEDTPASASPAEVPPGMVFKIGNDAEVFNGGTTPTFTTTEAYSVTELWTYHWNGGKGAPEGGTLSLESSDGMTYGPWQVEVKNNVYWIAKPNMVLPAGSYSVIDSEPGTLAKNKESNEQGHAWMYGTVSK